MKNYETANFGQDVLDASNKTPVVVDFWAEWCGPCRVLGPILERLHGKDAGRWSLVKVDTDRNQEIAAEYGIRGIPSVKLFVDGKVVNEFTGALPEKLVRQWLDSSLPDLFRDDLEKARKFILDGDESNGVAILEEILQKDPNHEEARVLLAKQLLAHDSKRAVELTSGIEADSDQFSLVEAIRTIHDIKEKHTNSGSLPESPVKSIYGRALKETASGDHDSAIEHFIEVIRMERKYDDDGARKACVALFTFLGEENATTLKHRRAFARALNT